MVDPSKKFLCPDCGGTHFGSNHTEGIYYCHDEFDMGCRWAGPYEACFVDDPMWMAANLIRRLMKQVWLYEATKKEGLRSALGEAQFAAYMQSHLTGSNPVYAEGVKWLDEYRDS